VEDLEGRVTLEAFLERAMEREYSATVARDREVALLVPRVKVFRVAAPDGSGLRVSEKELARGRQRKWMRARSLLVLITRSRRSLARRCLFIAMHTNSATVYVGMVSEPAVD
jgi:hypothetical protein